jgi:hypothetical protein
MAAEDGGIKHLIGLKIVELLTDACQTQIAETDDARVDTIGLRNVTQTGKERLMLIVRHMDPMRERANRDTTQSEDSRLWKNWPEAIIGGMYIEHAQGVVELKADFTRTREDASTADAIQQKVLGRAKRALLSGASQIRQLEDEFGESVQDFRVYGGEEYDSGEGTSNVGRYFIRWAALTLTGSLAL